MKLKEFLLKCCHDSDLYIYFPGGLTRVFCGFPCDVPDKYFDYDIVSLSASAGCLVVEIVEV